MNGLVSRYVTLKMELDAKQKVLRELAAEIQEQATFPEGKNTAHIIGAGYDVSVQRRENVKWDQKKLASIRSRMGDETFFKLFTWEFKPVSARQITGFMDYGDPLQVEALRDARTCTPGAPAITFTPIEQRGAA